MIIELVDADLGTLSFTHESGILLEEFDPGSPQVRAVESNAPDEDGTIDETLYYGSRVITASGKFLAPYGTTLTQVRKRVNQYLMPNRRPYLRWYHEDADSTIYTTQVRIDNSSLQIRTAHDSWSISWKAQPYWRIGDLHEVVAPYGGGSTLGGDPFPWLGGPSETITFESGIEASGWLPNDGNVGVYPWISLFGPAENPSVIALEPVQSIKFTGLSLPAGSVIDIDMRARTAVLDHGVNVFGYIDFDVSSWWKIPIGGTHVSITTSSPPESTTPFAVVRWYDLTV